MNKIAKFGSEILKIFLPENENSSVVVKKEKFNFDSELNYLLFEKLFFDLQQRYGEETNIRFHVWFPLFGKKELPIKEGETFFQAIIKMADRYTPPTHFICARYHYFHGDIVASEYLVFYIQKPQRDEMWHKRII